MADNDALTNALGVAGLAFGAAAVLAPRALSRIYGTASTAESESALRLYGTRNVAFALMTLRAPNEVVRNSLLRTVAGISVADTVLAVLTGVTGRANRRAALMTALTTAGVGALAWKAAS